MNHSVEEALGNRAVFESGALNVLLEAMQEAVIVTTVSLDAPGPTILHVNTAFERITGYSRRDVIGETPRMLQGPDTSRAVLARMRAALEAGETFEGEAINYRKDGSPFMLCWAVVPIFDDFGEAVAWLSVQRRSGTSGGASLEQRAVATERAMHEAAGK